MRMIGPRDSVRLRTVQCGYKSGGSLHGQYILCERSVKAFTECELRHNASLMLRAVLSAIRIACLGLVGSHGTLWPLAGGMSRVLPGNDQNINT
jgi:hypothetical protein